MIGDKDTSIEISVYNCICIYLPQHVGSQKAIARLFRL